MKKVILISLIILLVNFQFVHSSDIKKSIKYNIYEVKDKFEKDINLNKFYSAYYIYRFIFIGCNLMDSLTFIEKKDIITRILKILMKNNLAEIDFLKYSGNNDLIIKMTNNFKFTKDEENSETNRIIFISNYDRGKNKIISDKGITFSGNEFVYLFNLIDEKFIYYEYTKIKESDLNLKEIPEKADYYLLNEKDNDDLYAYNMLMNELNNKDLDKQKRFDYNYFLILYHLKNNSFDRIKEIVNENDILIKDLKNSNNENEHKMIKEFIDIYSGL